MKAKKRNDIKEEFHHILPKSIFDIKIARDILKINLKNKNDKNNIISLTFKEHYFAHLLLVKIFRKVNKNCYIKMLFAFNIMNNRGRKLYPYFREEFKKLCSKNLTGKPSRAKGCKWNEESKNNKKINHYMKNKTYEEIYGIEKAKQLKEKRKLSMLGKVRNPEIGKKISKSKKDKPSWSKGLTKEIDKRLDYVRPGSFKKGNRPHNIGKPMPENVKLSLLKAITGKIFITNGTINKIIDKKDLDYYLNQGFKKGRKVWKKWKWKKIVK